MRNLGYLFCKICRDYEEGWQLHTCDKKSQPKVNYNRCKIYWQFLRKMILPSLPLKYHVLHHPLCLQEKAHEPAVLFFAQQLFWVFLPSPPLMKQTLTSLQLLIFFI